MRIAEIEGATRTVGLSQGYRGLPLRDEVIDDPVNGPGTPQMVTAWEVYPDELERLGKGARIYLSILGRTPPPLLMDVGEPAEVTMSAFADVAAERRRQIEIEGWSEKHDDAHADGSLALAAALYASPRDDLKIARVSEHGVSLADPWPWSEWDKRRKHDRRRRLVIAAALLVAELERVDRLDARIEKHFGGRGK